VELREIRPGLWRWSSRHPEWREGATPGSPADWPAEVGSVACETADALVIIDPLVPVGEQAEFWGWMDPLAGRAEQVVALTTIKFHRRSRDELAARYDATTSRARDALPAGVRPIPIPGAGETMVWIEEHRALVPGDRIVGDGRGGLRMCPESWLGYLPSGITLEDLRGLLRPLLDLPIELVLVSHGEPMLENGREALRRALGG
jgi:hypothetical protein